jgi:hypothetical protein
MSTLVETLGHILNLAAPIAAASVCYGVFKFLDDKASDDANLLINSWMKSKDQLGQDKLVSTAIWSFDHLYGAPILRFRTFIRSALLPSIATAIYIVFIRWNTLSATMLLSTFLILIPTVIISDYISLFAIRKSLELSKQTMRAAIVTSLGASLVIIGTLVYLITALEQVPA